MEIFSTNCLTEIFRKFHDLVEIPVMAVSAGCSKVNSIQKCAFYYFLRQKRQMGNERDLKPRRSITLQETLRF